MNKLFLGNNLEILKKIPKESIDLIYIDPPFFSRAKRWAIKDKQWISFKDSAAYKGFDGYLKIMEATLESLKAVLKKTGSIYVHVDTRVNGYLRVIMDSIFGRGNFKSEIVWERNKRRSNMGEKKNYGKVTDRILFFTKSKEFTFNTQYNDYASKKSFKKDERGVYRVKPIYNMCFEKSKVYDYKGYKCPPNGWLVVKETMQEYEKKGLLVFGEKTIGKKSYNLPGVPLKDLWADLVAGRVNGSKEGCGYPTQKPLKLLERIIKISSSEGDTVLDCFCGSGTTLHAAHSLKRNWIGIDSNPEAINIVKERLKDAKFTLFRGQSRDSCENSQRID